MTVVTDASVALAAFIPGSAHSDWASELLTGNELVAPELIVPEVLHVLRRMVNTGRLEPGDAVQVRDDFVDMIGELIPHKPLITRSWELRSVLSGYDSMYVAAAELLGLPFATVDLKIASAPGVRCEVVTPPS
jgi:predicted nucleic acid-binding protein